MLSRRRNPGRVQAKGFCAIQKNGTTHFGAREPARQRRQQFRNQYDALWFQRASNTRQDLRGAPPQQSLAGRISKPASFERAFKDMREKKTNSLKLAQNDFGRLPRWRDFRYLQQSACFTLEFSRIQEVPVGLWRDSTEQNRANVDGPIACSPFKALKTSGNVFGGCGLSATVAVQGICQYGLQTRIVVEWSQECKSEETRIGPKHEFLRPAETPMDTSTTAVRRGW